MGSLESSDQLHLGLIGSSHSHTMHHDNRCILKNTFNGIMAGCLFEILAYLLLTKVRLAIPD